MTDETTTTTTTPTPTPDPTEVFKGKVKWFNNRKGFGYITPTSDNAPIKDDIFVYVDAIVVDYDGPGKPYKTLKADYEVQFTVTKDEGIDKLRAQNVKSADGTPVPIPPRRERKPKTTNTDDNGGGAETANGEGDAAAAATSNGSKKSNNNRRRRNKKKGGAAKSDENGGTDETKAAEETEPKPKKDPTWETTLDDSVQKSMTDRNVIVDNQGRAFVAIGDDVRVKLGTDSYAALAHSNGLLAEGEWSVEPNGKVTFVWNKVLKWSEGDGDDDEAKAKGSWSTSSADAESSVLLATLDLTDDAVQPTEDGERVENLWGKEKVDPKATLVDNGFMMKRMIISSGHARQLRRRTWRRNKKASAVVNA